MLPSDTAPEHDAEHDAHPAAGPEVPTESVSLGALSLPARLTVAVAVGAVAVYTVWHLAMVFLFVAPSNTLSEDYRDTVRGYIYPEFEQNWKLFAPNPSSGRRALRSGPRYAARTAGPRSPTGSTWAPSTSRASGTTRCPATPPRT